jgi:transposase InsO family protein
VIGLARSSLQYRPARRDDEALRLALIRLAKQYGNYGYRKIAELLRIEGWKLNHKKVERTWREEGLQLPQRHRKRRRLYHKDSSINRLRPTHPNHVWSIDFVHDKLSNGRSYKMLTVLDEYTRQALALAVRTRMGADDVLEVVYPLLLRHGTPEYLRSDNGPEFVTEAMQDWLARVGIKPIRIFPGSPWENGYNERFNGTLRHEVLNPEWFTTTKQAQIVINQWLRQHCPLFLFGYAGMSAVCRLRLLLHAKKKPELCDTMFAFDPERTIGPQWIWPSPCPVTRDLIKSYSVCKMIKVGFPLFLGATCCAGIIRSSLGSLYK